MYIQRELNNIIMNATTPYTIGELFKNSILHKKFIPNNIGGDANDEGTVINDFWFYLIFGDPCTRLICTVPEIKSTF